MTRSWKAPWLALAAAHLVLVCLGAFHAPVAAWEGPLARGLAWYGAFSGAHSPYGFFAFRIESNRIRFELRDPEGRTRTVGLEDGASRESRLRIGNLTGAFFHYAKEEKVRRSITASWAAKILARHPECRDVRVLVEVYDLPTISAYRAGLRPRWHTFYEARFLRSLPHL